MKRLNITFYQMEDFQIFGITWQRKVAQDTFKEIIHAGQ